MASSRSEPIEWPALKVHCGVDFEIERHALAAAHVLDDDIMHRQTQARPDQPHAFDDRLVVERDRIGGDGQIRLRPLLAAPRRKLRPDRRHPIRRQRAGHRNDELAGDPCAAGAKPDRHRPRDSWLLGDEPHRVGPSVGSASPGRRDSPRQR
jgi:hypothetical protein